MSVAQAQRRNPELVSLLSADLQPRYEPNFAWKGICGLYQSLPALRGFWPMSAQINSTQAAYVTDVANNFHLTNYNTAQHGYDDLIPYVDFNGTTQALYYADNAQFDILGTEANVVAAQRGLTLGAWITTNLLYDVANKSVMSKMWGDVTYWLLRGNAGGTMKFGISSNGGWGGWQTVESTASLDTTQWHLCIGRFTPITTLDIFLNGIKTSSPTAIASIVNGANEFNIGASANHTSDWWDGKISMAFICAAALSDSIIEAIWQQTRAMYGR